MRRTALWVTLAASLFASASSAQTLRRVTAEDLIGITDLGVPAVSDDGRFVAIEARRADLVYNTTVIRWTVVDLKDSNRVIDVGAGGAPILERFKGQITGFSLPQKPIWSPDSQWIAYRAQHDGAIQVWRSRRDATFQEQITHAAGGIESFCWSNDGLQLIYATSSTKQAHDRALHEEGERGYLYDDRFAPFYSRTPLFDPGPSQSRSIWVHNIASGVERLATPEEAQRLEAQQGRASDQFLQPARSVGVNPPMTLVGCQQPECTGYFKGVWPSEDGRSFHFLRWVNSRNYGTLALYHWRVGAPHVTELLRTDDLIEHCERLRSQLVCAQESATTPRKLLSIDLTTRRRATIYDPNSDFAHLQFGQVTPITWRDEAAGIEGFGHVVLPVDHRAGHRYPLIVVQYRSRGFLRGGIGDEYPIHVLSARGFAVLSFNRPDDWELEAAATTYEDLEEKGWIGLRDRRRVLSVLEAGIDELDNRGLIDPTRVGITGLSDGGETVGFALVHSPDRFAAAAASWTWWSPIAYYLAGGKFQPQFRRYGLGDPEGPARDQWQQLSVALNAQRVRTPLLLQVADHELLPETQLHARLREQGRAVELYVFPNEYHVKSQPIHRYAIYRRNVQWFRFWLLDIEDPDPVDPAQYARWRALRTEHRARLPGA